jgi:hypothetical protein
VKLGITEQRADTLGLQVHAVNMPVGVGKNVLAQMMADEAIDTENENVFQDKPLRLKVQVSASGWFDRADGGAFGATGS